MRRVASLKGRDLEEEIRSEHPWSYKVKALSKHRSVPGVVFLLCMISLFFQMRQEKLKLAYQDVDSVQGGPGRGRSGSAALAHADEYRIQVTAERLQSSSPLLGWQASSAMRNLDWPRSTRSIAAPPEKTNGYLVVRCNGGLNQQRGAICNAVLAARIMNATLVLPELDTNSFWHDNSGFSGIYDTEHFIAALANDVTVVKALPLVGRKRQRRMKPFHLRPPRDASPSWYQRVALASMRQHGAIFLSPFSHRLTESLDNHEYQRLRCRVNFHALRFREDVMELSSKIVSRLRAEGQFLAIHLRFELDMLAFAGCVDIFPPAEQETLTKYRKDNFAEKTLNYTERRLIGKCPLTPEEVGLILRSLGYDSSTRIYVAAGEIFGGEHFIQPLRQLFPHLENRTTMATPAELKKITTEGRGLLGPAVDYMVCLLSDIFVPSYDGPSNFANNLLGHRLYFGFRTTIRPDRKALAPLFIQREEGILNHEEFESKARAVMQSTWVGGPHARVELESFYTNPWPECFCKPRATRKSDQCPSDIQLLAQVEDDQEVEGGMVDSDTAVAEAGGDFELLLEDTAATTNEGTKTSQSRGHQGKDLDP